MTELWEFQVIEVTEPIDLTGLDVEATDGSIGKIDEATYETGSGCIVVDTGWWIFGKKRMIPAGAIESLDLADRKVLVSLSKDQIRDAPDFDASRRDDAGYRGEIGDYYSRF